MAKAANTAAIERASGMRWAEWSALLTERGGDALSHPELAAVAHERLAELGVDSAGWWAQGVAVAFEQEIGRRKPGQRGDGSHEFSVSKTFGRDLDHALETWAGVAASAAPFRGVSPAAEPTTSASEKWRYWRATLDDGTKLEATIGARANGAAYLALAHTGFADDVELADWKAYWKGLLAEAASTA